MGVSPTDYPAIPFNDDDRIREESLKKIGRAFQAEMDAQANPCALKGGTALRFTLGLTRPSTDLDFEGDKRIEVKKSLKRALRNGLPDEKYRVGLDWGKLGTIRLRRAGWSKRGRPYLKIDYRLTGTFTGMPARTPLELTELRDGIRRTDNRTSPTWHPSPYGPVTNCDARGTATLCRWSTLTMRSVCSPATTRDAGPTTAPMEGERSDPCGRSTPPPSS